MIQATIKFDSFIYMKNKRKTFLFLALLNTTKKSSHALVFTYEYQPKELEYI